MTRDEQIRNAIDTIFPIPPSEKGRKYEQALMATGFEGGVKWADANPKSPWISVEDDLPCNHDELIDGSSTVEVFATCKNGYFSSTYMIKGLKKWVWYDFKPDYWMIPPKLPKE